MIGYHYSQTPKRAGDEATDATTSGSASGGGNEIGEEIDAMQLARPESVSTSARMHSMVWKVTAVVWARFVFYLSTEIYGPKITESLVGQALSFLHLPVSSASFELIQHLVRKLAHLAEYAILTVLLCGSSKDKGRFNWRSPRPLWCFLIAVAYSLMDEFHQRFVPGRNSSLADCGIDSIGGAMGILIYYVNHLLLRPGQKAGASSGP